MALREACSVDACEHPVARRRVHAVSAIRKEIYEGCACGATIVSPLDAEAKARYESAVDVSLQYRFDGGQLK